MADDYEGIVKYNMMRMFLMLDVNKYLCNTYLTVIFVTKLVKFIIFSYTPAVSTKAADAGWRLSSLSCICSIIWKIFFNNQSA